MAGHFSDATRVDRVRRILAGELSREDSEFEMQGALAQLVAEARAVGRA